MATVETKTVRHTLRCIQSSGNPTRIGMEIGPYKRMHNSKYDWMGFRSFGRRENNKFRRALEHPAVSEKPFKSSMMPQMPIGYNPKCPTRTQA